MLVLFTYKNGRKAPMQKRYATILQNLKHGTFDDVEHVRTSSKSTPPPLEVKPQEFVALSEPVNPASEQNTASDQSTVSDEPESKTQLVSAAAKKLADDFKINLLLVTGTGKDGQITKTDVENFIDDNV